MGARYPMARRRPINDPRQLVLALSLSTPAEAPALLEAALEGPNRRQMLAFLAAYIASCAIGAVPNLTRWNPPK